MTFHIFRYCMAHIQYKTNIKLWVCFYYTCWSVACLKSSICIEISRVPVLPLGVQAIYCFLSQYFTMMYSTIVWKTYVAIVYTCANINNCWWSLNIHVLSWKHLVWQRDECHIIKQIWHCKFGNMNFFVLLLNYIAWGAI